MIAMESICTTENDSWIGRILKITYQKKKKGRIPKMERQLMMFPMLVKAPSALKHIGLLEPRYKAQMHA